jgi:hypothetical protein
MTCNLTAIAALASALLCAAVPARADSVYDNFGPGDPFNGHHGKGLSPVQYIAMPFTVAPGPGFDLTEIDIALVYDPLASAVNAAVVQLVMDYKGLPGSFIDSWVLSGLPTVGTTTLQPVQQITGPSRTHLDGGAQYWLVANGLSNWISWAATSSGALGPFAVSQDAGASWALSLGTEQSAFRVLGTPTAAVPEPGAAVLLALGLATLAVAGRRPST